MTEVQEVPQQQPPIELRVLLKHPHEFSESTIWRRQKFADIQMGKVKPADPGEQDRLAHEIQVLSARKNLLYQDEHVPSLEDVHPRLSQVEQELQTLEGKKDEKSHFERQGLLIRKELLLARQKILRHATLQTEVRLDYPVNLEIKEPTNPPIEYRVQLANVDQFEEKITWRKIRLKEIEENGSPEQYQGEAKLLAHELDVLSRRRGLLQEDQHTGSPAEILKKLKQVNILLEQFSGKVNQAQYGLKTGLEIRKKILLERYAKIFTGSIDTKILEHVEWDDIPVQDINSLFEELTFPSSDALSCLRLAKAVMADPPNPQQLKPDDDKKNLVLWLVQTAVNTNPKLFGTFSDKINTQLLAIQNQLAQHKIDWIQKNDAILAGMKQGQAYEKMSHNQAEFYRTLQEGKPLVITLTNNAIGFGDIVLITPIIQDLANSLKIMKSKSQIRFVIRAPIAEVVKGMLDGNDNIEVISHNDPKKVDEEKLTLLASRDKLGHDKPEDRGIILMWHNTERLGEPKFPPGQKFQYLSGLVSYPYKSNDPNVSNTFRRAAQRAISDHLGVKIYDTSTRDNLQRTSNNLARYLDQYASEPAHSLLRKQYEDIRKTQGFEGGYICIIAQGSNNVKRVTPELSETMAAELSEYCKAKKIGIVILREAERGNIENKTLIDIYKRHGIPTQEVFTTPSMADTFYLLRKARGTIGPDTLPTHVAEFFTSMSKPTINLFLNSSAQHFRISNDTIPDTHPLAEKMNDYVIAYAGRTIDAYANNIIHPCKTTNTTALHPMIKEIQDLFRRRTREALRTFIKQLDTAA